MWRRPLCCKTGTEKNLWWGERPHLHAFRGVSMGDQLRSPVSDVLFGKFLSFNWDGAIDFKKKKTV